jgi:hypothetical protein
VGRLTAIKAIQGALREIAPMTSTGNFGVEGMRNQTAQRGQDIVAQVNYRGQDISQRGQDVVSQSASEGHAVTARGQDIHANLMANAQATDALYKAGMLEHGKEELGIKKMMADSKNPENFIKMATALSPKIKSVDPATQAEVETHDLRAGIKSMTDMGFELPEKFKVPGQGKVPTFEEFAAAAKKNKSKLSTDQLTQYYNEKYQGR